ncbi:MAG: hypothetical protein QW683_08735 [Candidatus Caldarchaeum sp.]
MSNEDPVYKTFSAEAEFSDQLKALKLTEAIDNASLEELREAVKKLTRLNLTQSRLIHELILDKLGMGNL